MNRLAVRVTLLALPFVLTYLVVGMVAKMAGWL
jgi:hypothetical protein